MIKKYIKILVLSSLLLSLLVISPIRAEENGSLLKFIKNNTLENVKANSSKEEEFQILVSSSTKTDLQNLKQLLDSKNSTLDQKKLVIKALGLKKDKNAQAYLWEILENTKNKDLLYLSAWALIETGDTRNFELVMKNIDKLKIQLGQNELYFKILANLAYKYKNTDLLSKFSPYLKESPENNMKVVYLYTIFGRSFESVISLNKELDDTNKNKKYNAAEILGKWYAAENSIMGFQDILTNSDDSKLREVAIIGLAEIGNFHARRELQLALKTAKTDEEKTLVKGFIKELDNIVKMIKEKPLNSIKYAVFNDEYSKLYNSKGFYGSYELMGKNAKYTDIIKLEKLKETIMLNMSKDASINYLKVNKIIRKLRIKKEFSKK